MTQHPRTLIQAEQHIKQRYALAIRCTDPVSRAAAAFERERLRRLHQNWAAMHSWPLIRAMTAVVEEVVTAYPVDFYSTDLELIAARPDRPFAWYVRPFGTDLIYLAGSDSELAYSSRLLHALWRYYGGHDEVDPTGQCHHRLYYGDPTAGTLTRLSRFSDLPLSFLPIAWAS